MSTSTFKCPKCGKVLSSSYSLNYHIVKKVCYKPDRICPTCERVFKTKRSYQYHIEQNVCTRVKPKLRLKVKYAQMSHDDLVAEIAQLKGKYDALRENPQNVTTNTINNVVVFPDAFGGEKIERVCQKLGDILGPLIRNHTFSSIPNLFGVIHNSQQLPEYHNVFSPSERSSYALVSDGKTFRYRPKKTIIDQIIEDKRSILNQYVDQNGDLLGQKVLKKYEKYQNDIDSDSEFRKILELEIGGMLLDMKAVIADDGRTRHLLDKVTEGDFELPSQP